MAQLCAFSNNSTVCKASCDKQYHINLTFMRKVQCRASSAVMTHVSQITHSLEQAVSLGTFSKSQTFEKSQGCLDQHDPVMRINPWSNQVLCFPFSLLTYICNFTSSVWEKWEKLVLSYHSEFNFIISSLWTIWSSCSLVQVVAWLLRKR